MHQLTKHGATITVSRDSQAAVYRSLGWVDATATPSMSNSKAELVVLAVEAGWDRDKAEAATKQDLVDSLT